MFRNKKRTYTSASFNELMTEDMLPDTIQASILNSILEKRPATSNLLNDIANGPPVLLQRFYKRASSGKYPYGNPKSSLHSLDLVDSEFRDWLRDTVSPSIDIEYANFSPFHERHHVWHDLVNNHGYDAATNIVANPPITGTPISDVYVSDMVVVLDGSVEDSGDPLDPNEHIPEDPNTYEDWETPAKDRPHPWRAEFPGDPIQTSYSEAGDTGAIVSFVYETLAPDTPQFEEWSDSSLITWSQSSVAAGENAADSTNMRDQDGSTGTVASGPDSFIQADLGTAVPVSSVIVGAGSTLTVADIAAILNGSVIEASDDGVTWSHVDTVSGVTNTGPTQFVEFHIATPTALRYWRLSNAADLGVTEFRFQVERPWVPKAVKEDVYFPTPEGGPDMEYFQAKYLYDDGSGEKPYYFSYDGMSEVYPALDALSGYSGGDDLLEFMPYLHLRSEKQDLAREEVRDTEVFKETERMFKLLGIDMIDLADSINANDDINKIEQASVGFHFKLNTDSKWGKKYIFHFFEWLLEEGMDDGSKTKAISVRDDLLDMSLRFESLTDNGIISGSIGDVGTYDVDRFTSTTNINVKFWTPGGPLNKTVKVKQHSVRARYQFSETEYKEILVNSPTMFVAVRGKGAKGTLEKFDSEDFNLMIPVSRKLVDRFFKFREREKVYYASLGLVVTTYYRVTVKWYQRGAFKLLLNVVAVVLLIVSLGTSIAASLALSGAATAAAVASVVLITVLKFVLKAVLIDLAFKIIIQELGVEVGAILAALAAAVGAGRQLYTGSITDNLGNTLVHMSTVATKYTTVQLQKDVAEIYSSVEGDREEYEIEMQRIEDKKHELGLDRMRTVDPSVVLAGTLALMNPNESPNNWLNKAIHNGNIGTLALDYAENFVALMLALPEPEHT